MNDLKPIIAKNISELRTANGMTQIELAEKLNYSDKAVSKWERGESVPDIAVLAEIADMFGVTLDYLIQPEHKTKDVCTSGEALLRRKRRRMLVTGMSILLGWLVATLVFVIFDITLKSGHVHWLVFAYAVPVCMIIWLVFNSIWFNRRRNYLIISLLMWTLLAALQLTFLAANLNIWQIYFLGLPGQIIILLWSRMGYKKK